MYKWIEVVRFEGLLDRFFSTSHIIVGFDALHSSIGESTLDLEDTISQNFLHLTNLSGSQLCHSFLWPLWIQQLVKEKSLTEMENKSNKYIKCIILEWLYQPEREKETVNKERVWEGSCDL